MFPEQDHEAHVRAHVTFLATPAAQVNPQGFALLQAHVQEHVGLMAKTK